MSPMTLAEKRKRLDIALAHADDLYLTLFPVYCQSKQDHAFMKLMASINQLKSRIREKANEYADG